jgi:isochorismate synthase
VRWGDKEIVEQELVSRYVRTFFEDAGYPNFVEQGPQTVTAGKVFHLQSSFSIDLPEAERLHLANQVLSELHPTSAVCGMPRREALSFIVEQEGYDRSFYSGFLGPVFVDEGSTLFVNLRCMQLFPTSATLYVGGGITADSDPEAEWHETVVKSQTILAVLGSAGAEPATPAPAEPTHATTPASTASRYKDDRFRASHAPSRTSQRHPASQAHFLVSH